MYRTMTLVIVALFALSACSSVSEAEKKQLANLETTVKVLKSSQDIEPGTELTEEMITVVEFPAEFLPPAPLLAGDKDDWLGQEVQLKVNKGRILEGRDFQSPGGMQAFKPPREPLVLTVADGERRASPNGKAIATVLVKGEEAYFGILEMQGGASVPAHQDPTEEFIYIVEGSGTMTIDGTEYEVAAGTFVYMPKEAEVSFESKTPVRAVQVFGGPEPASKYDTWTPVTEEKAETAE